MFVRITSTPNSPRKAVKVVESVRVGIKVSQKIVRHIGIALDDQEVDKLKQIAYEYIASQKAALDAKQPTLFPDRSIDAQSTHLSQAATAPQLGRPKKKPLAEIIPPEQVSLTDVIETQRVIEGVHDVAGCVYDSLGYKAILSAKKDQKILKDLVLGRLVSPYSKHRLHKILDQKFGITHDLDTIYRTLDKLFERIAQVKSITFLKTQRLIPGPLDLLFFDVSTLYFESTTTDGLREFGYSKDHRFNTTQVVLALATNQDGLPIGYELFAGNIAEVTTLVQALDSWKESLPIKEVCFVGDRAMFSQANLQLLEERHYTYVIAAKLRSLSKAMQEQIQDADAYHPLVIKDEFAWAAEFTYQGRRLVVSYKHTRAERDQAKRQEVLTKIEKTLGKSKDSKKAITNKGIKKYTTTDKTSQTTIDLAKVEADSLWDGLHGVITNMKKASIAELLARYARLWVIEESFRVNKHTLAMRPIYHFKPERIQAHIALCYMTFTTLRHLQYKVNLTTKISVEQILDELMAVQASIYVHKKTGDKYRVPGVFSQAASKIYRCFGLTRSLDATAL